MNFLKEIACRPQFLKQLYWAFILWPSPCQSYSNLQLSWMESRFTPSGLIVVALCYSYTWCGASDRQRSYYKTETNPSNYVCLTLPQVGWCILLLVTLHTFLHVELTPWFCIVLILCSWDYLVLEKDRNIL